MQHTRRELLGAGAALAAIAVGDQRTANGEQGQAVDNEMPRLRFGMCDWSLGKWDPSVFDLAAEIGLDGVQLSIGKQADDMYLRKPDVQKAFLEAARKHKMGVASLALGILNNVPLMSEPRAAIWVADSIDIMKRMGTDQVLLAFFSKGELKEDSAEDMRRVTDVLLELAPRAEKAGVVLAIESYLTAEANLKILDAVKSPAVQVYYDVYNSWVTKGHDPIKEIKLLGGKRISQVHLKEGGELLGASGKIDWPAVAAVLKEIGYRGWLVLETSAPSKDIVKDTRTNLEHAKKTFAALAT